MGWTWMPIGVVEVEPKVIIDFEAADFPHSRKSATSYPIWLIMLSIHRE